jgi:hypothetical protein
MNTDQIDSILRKRCGDEFLGVFAIDNLPVTLPARRPIMLVCNTDPARQPGKHWIVLYIDAHGEYFDSFGRAPNSTFKTFLNEHCLQWNFNDKQLQSATSRFCGQYCVFYCFYRHLKIDAAVIIASLTTDTGLNDWMVHTFVCKNLL